MSEPFSSDAMVDSKLVAPRNWVPSENFGPRADGAKIDMLLMHYTSTPTNAYALELLTSPDSHVSSHYLIDGEGVIYQMVREVMRAWHAGESCWAGERDINSCSIGIEIQNQGASVNRVPAYGRAQMKAVVALSCDIVERYKIRPERVLAHSDVAPHRKQDPGSHFDWQALHDAGAGCYVDPEPIFDEAANCPNLSKLEVVEIQKKFKKFGYEIKASGEVDERTRIVVTAFQRHFRQTRVDGVIDRSTIRTLDKLIAQLFA